MNLKKEKPYFMRAIQSESCPVITNEDIERLVARFEERKNEVVFVIERESCAKPYVRSDILPRYIKNE